MRQWPLSVSFAIAMSCVACGQTGPLTLDRPADAAATTEPAGLGSDAAAATEPAGLGSDAAATTEPAGVEPGTHGERASDGVRSEPEGHGGESEGPGDPSERAAGDAESVAGDAGEG